MKLVLACGIENPKFLNTGGHTAHDKYANYVEKFFGKAGLPYSAQFVSIMCAVNFTSRVAA
jgi:hypothetical protein